MAENTNNRLTGMLLSKSRRAQYLKVFAVLAACVVVAVAIVLHQNGVAMTHKEQVLTCPVTGAVAHTHDESCYDKDGNLVCTLPERELHTHTDACYTETRELTCGLEESDGHKHTEACYDANTGELICGQEESEGHHHTDACYTVTRELTCGLEEITETHVHGAGCFTTVEVNDEVVTASDAKDGVTANAAMPAQNFTGELKDQDNKVVMQVEVTAPEGAFPANTTMKIAAIDSKDIKGSVDKAVAQKSADGVVKDIQAVDITFYNEAGQEIEPATDITVRFVSDLIAKNTDSYVVHVNDKGDGAVVDALTPNQVAERNQQTSDDALLISAKEFSPYAVVTVSLQHTLTASDGNKYVITVDCPAEANVPQNAELEVTEITEGAEGYDAYLKEVTDKIEDEVTFARFFDIKIVADGKEIQPSVPVTVKVELNLKDETPEEAKAVADAEEAKAVHFTSDDKAEVIDAALDKNAVSFEAKGFSVYAVVGTKLATEFTISNPDGNDVTYLVTVTYGPEAEIPEGSTLKVEEYKPGSKEYDAAKEQLIKTEQSDGASSWLNLEQGEGDTQESAANDDSNAGLTVFDVSIIGPNGQEVEPKAPVNVKVEMKKLPDNTDEAVLENSMELKHFVENGGEPAIENVASTNNTYGVSGGEINVSDKGVVAEFDLNSFSVFAFTWGSKQANIIAHHVDASGKELLLDNQTADVSLSGNHTYTLSNSQVHGGVSGYNYTSAYIRTVSGEEKTVTKFTTSNSNNKSITFYNNNTEIAKYTAPFNVDLFFVYEPEDAPSGGTGGASLDAPKTDKKLTPNGDGTYTLSLSVKGTRDTSDSSTHANVVVVYDSSNSMNKKPETTYEYTAADKGRYGLVNGQYVKLYYRWYGQYYEVGENDTHGTVYRASGYSYVQYTGTRYNQTVVSLSRHDVAKRAVKSLAESLLSNNTEEQTDLVELAFVDFATIVRSVNGASFTLNNSLTPTVGKTTNLQTFKGWVDAVSVSDNESNRYGATNWEEALKVANLYNFGDNDPTYIIFVSDGEPTVRVSRNVYNENPGPNDYFSSNSYYNAAFTENGRTVDVYGTGNSDNNKYDLGAAVSEAKAILKANKKLFTVGAFIPANNTTMQLLGGEYYNAADQSSLEAAFQNIIRSITMDVAYTDVKITDGITDMTATALASGDIGNLQYFKNGQLWPVAQMEAEGAKQARFEAGSNGRNKKVIWNLGENYKLEKDVEYKVTFTVWPKQEDYDLLAALNNGMLHYGDDYTYTADDGSTKTIPAAEYTKQIVKDTEGKYIVMTNTAAGIKYKVVTEQSSSDGSSTTTTGSEQSATIENPKNGMGLDKSQVTVNKEWEDELDPTQLLKLLETNPDYKVNLVVKANNNAYATATIAPDIHRDLIGNVTGADWPGATVYIAPGVMLSTTKATEKGINVDSDRYQKITYNGTTYVILESGHEYSIDEPNTDYHFELKAQTYHPMVVDGQVQNVTFTFDNGSISGITAIDTENSATLTATNQLRAGINIRKKVIDEKGTEIYPEDQYFYLRVSFKDENGTPIKFSNYQDPDKDAPLTNAPYIAENKEAATVSIGENTYPIWYNIYQGAKDDMDIEGTYKPEGSEGYVTSYGVAEDGGIIRVKAGDVLRFTNVPVGTQLAVKEIDVPNGYVFDKYMHKESKASTNWTDETNMDTGYSITAAANTSYYLMCQNQQSAPDVKIQKVSSDNVNAVIKDTAKFKLYTDVNHTTAAKNIDGQEIGEISTNEGIADLGRLAIGTYYLVETQAPSGYNTMSTHVIIEVTANGVTYNQAEYAASASMQLKPTMANGVAVYTLIVTNSSGQELPHTGGMGTTAIYATGAALVGIAAYGLASKKLRNNL